MMGVKKYSAAALKVYLVLFGILLVVEFAMVLAHLIYTLSIGNYHGLIFLLCTVIYVSKYSECTCTQIESKITNVFCSTYSVGFVLLGRGEL